MEAIILAGGLGTRLKDVSSHTPKSMAMVQGRPFLEYQMDGLIQQGVKSFVLSVGYKSEQIQNHFGDRYKDHKIVYAIENEPLGTGGAIKNALRFTQEENVVVANGDSLVVSDLQKQMQFHIDKGASVTLALKKMKDFKRYGTVQFDKNFQIQEFVEKRPVSEGIINAGLYVFNVRAFLNMDWSDKFSIEKDYFESCVNTTPMYGFLINGYFLDIGVPEDFKKAQTEIGTFFNIDKSWSLFLDRDGVINKKRDNDYVKSIEELELLPGALSAISVLSKYFGKIFIVTNQQGIGKELMTEEDLALIHQHLISQIQENGGRIDGVYHAPHLVAENSEMRKPKIGMAVKAKQEFPAVDFKKSIMVGDSKSDMEFGKNAGMTNVMIQKKEQEGNYTLSSLHDFATLIGSMF